MPRESVTAARRCRAAVSRENVTGATGPVSPTPATVGPMSACGGMCRLSSLRSQRRAGWLGSAPEPRRAGRQAGPFGLPTSCNPPRAPAQDAAVLVDGRNSDASRGRSR